MEDFVEKNCIDLRTVARIQIGDRLNTTREFMTIDEPTMLRGAWRRYEGDDRDRAVWAICRAVNGLVIVAAMLFESRFLVSESLEVVGLLPAPMPISDEQRMSRLCLLKKIRLVLLAAKPGLVKFCATYSDPNIDSRIVPLQESIDRCIIDINTVLISAGECELVVA